MDERRREVSEPDRNKPGSSAGPPRPSGRRTPAQPRGSSGQPGELTGKEALGQAKKNSQRETKRFHRILDAHMRGDGDAAQVMQAAARMWAANQILRKLELKYGKRGRIPGRSKSRSRSQQDLFGVRQVLPGSYESGKRR